MSSEFKVKVEGTAISIVLVVHDTFLLNQQFQAYKYFKKKPHKPLSSNFLFPSFVSVSSICTLPTPENQVLPS